MKNAKYKWIYTAHSGDRSSREFKLLTLSFRLAIRKDAAEDLAQVVRDGGRADYYKERAEEIRRATRQTEYWDTVYNQEFEIRFQANLPGRTNYSGETQEPTDWYGMRLESGNITQEVAKAITALAKSCGWECSPFAAIEALRSVPARYLDNHCFVDADHAEALESPKAKADKEKAKEENAA